MQVGPTSVRANSKTLAAPSGEIEDYFRGRSGLAKGYRDFLYAVDPLRNWEQVQPLPTPIEIDKTYPEEQSRVEAVEKLFPVLVAAYRGVSGWGEMARDLGFRYAWSRLHLHAELLDALDMLYSSRKPPLIIEPGCFNGGIGHYLPTAWDTCYWGSDVSPIALDVFRKLERVHSLAGKRLLSRCSFLELPNEAASHFLEQQNAPGLEGAVLLLSNIMGGFEEHLRLFPFLSQDGYWPTYCLLLSYWVNAGATVVMCGGHDAPESLVKAIASRGFWQCPVDVTLLKRFDTYLTAEMTPADPLGQWGSYTGYVIDVRKSVSDRT